MDKSLQELIDAYCQDPTQGLRNAIITEAMPLVKSIIGKIRNPDTPLSQNEDLESVGIMGLLQALEKYDGDKNIKFNTFAYYRIRGSVIDYLRSIDELPRSDRTNYGKARQVMDQLSQELGREPEDEEVAERLEMPLEKYYKLLSSVQQRAVLSLDHHVYGEDGPATLGDRIEDDNMERPDTEMDRKSISTQLQTVIRQLKERDRLVLSLYYYEDLTLNEIAMLLGLSEARISQIVGKLLLQLKSSLSADIPGGVA